jgi:hypothetical protein
MARRAAATAEQIQFENRKTRSVGFKRTRRQGPNAPARCRGALRRRCSDTQHQNGDTAFRRCQRQPATCRKIELFGFAPKLHEDGAEPGAARRLLTRPQNTFRISCSDKNDLLRIEAKFDET